jgi:hypothetical protein
MRQVGALPDAFMSIVTRNRDPIEVISEWVAANITPENEETKQLQRESLGRAFGYPFSRWFSETYRAPDEIGPMKIHPRMGLTRKVFLAFVHVYLLLMFIVSFPGSRTTRTKMMSRSKDSSARKVSDSEDESDSSDEEEVPCTIPPALRKRKEKRLSRKDCGFVKGGILLRALRTSASEDAPEISSSVSPLKKKSLSYFL